MRDYIKYFDKFTFFILLLLTTVGLITIYSASHSIREPHFTKQLIWLFIALIAFFVSFRFKTELAFNFSFFLK